MNCKRFIDVAFAEVQNQRIGGVFEGLAPDRYDDYVSSKHPGQGRFIKWYCQALDTYFWAGSGKSWEQARGFAVRKLKKMLLMPGNVRVM